MIGRPCPGMERELMRLWEICFGDAPGLIRRFFAVWYKPEHCLVYTVAGKAAAAVYMLPCHMQARGKLFPGHYIYAAATLPAYRGRGYMASLMAAAALEGAGRGQMFSAVLPAEESLYAYYGRFGYREYFEAEHVEAAAEELDAWAGKNHVGRTLLSPREAVGSQSAFLAGREGSLFWRPRDILYAFLMNRFCGGKLVAAGNSFAKGFALCGEAAETRLVSELSCSRELFPQLLGALLREAPAERYRFRLPVGKGRELFGREGKRTPFGMVKSLSGWEIPRLAECGPPWLSFPLD